MKNVFHLDEHERFRMRVQMTKMTGKAANIFRYAVLIGISYIILSPLIPRIKKQRN